MAGYGAMKMKRKDLDEVNDEFSDFSLSSPARKIRRLDAELPPILEEEEPEMPLAFEESKAGGSVMEEFSHVPMNEERAIVLFKPMNAPLLHSPSNFSVSVDSDIISGFKNFWSSGHSNCLRPAEEEEATRDKDFSKENLAVIPWVPSQVPQSLTMEAPLVEAPELMEAEEMEGTTMEIESDSVSTGHGQLHEFGGLRGSEVHSQLQQQHCMATQLPQNMSTPINWYQ